MSARCICSRAVDPAKLGSPRRPATPVLVATFADGELVRIVRQHWANCGLPDVVLDTRDYEGRPSR